MQWYGNVGGQWLHYEKVVFCFKFSLMWLKDIREKSKKSGYWGREMDAHYSARGYSWSVEHQWECGTLVPLIAVRLVYTFISCNSRICCFQTISIQLCFNHQFIIVVFCKFGYITSSFGMSL